MTQERLQELLTRARRLEADGQDEQAKAAYLELLSIDDCHFAALNELGTLALSSGHRSAAQTAYARAVQCHPDNPVGRVNLGNVLFENGELAAAREQYQAALASRPDLAEAHQGLARTLELQGEAAAAEAHWHRGFAGHALVRQRYRGRGAAIPVLLLVSVKPGNIPTRQILDDRTFQATALYAEFYDTAQPLPPHALVFNAIGDADLCQAGLRRAQALLERTAAPVINAASRVLVTGRAENAARLRQLPDVIAPVIQRLERDAIHSAALQFPLLLRAPGFHTGQHFVRVEQPAQLAAAAAALPGKEILAIEYLDARGTDGMARKYRVMMIDGELYPLHLAISSDWKVHYFTASMAGDPKYRAEEAEFLADMPGVLGPRAMSALQRIAQTLGLEYAGIDFALRDGAVLLFESNANMAIVPPDANPIWDYRRQAIRRVIDAAKQMVMSRRGVLPSTEDPRARAGHPSNRAAPGRPAGASRSRAPR
jgi:tetratricopeptide (TPR) repeat protein